MSGYYKGYYVSTGNAESRALADLPVLPGDPALPARATPRAELLQRGAETMRDRQRAQLERYLVDGLQAVERDKDNRRNFVGAVMAAHTMDVISYDEANAWIDRAWEASRAAR